MRTVRVASVDQVLRNASSFAFVVADSRVTVDSSRTLM